MMRVVVTAFAALAMVSSAAAQTGTWQIDPNHTSAQFAVRHLAVSTVRGAFTKMSGSAKYDAADLRRPRWTRNRCRFGPICG